MLCGTVTTIACTEDALMKFLLCSVGLLLLSMLTAYAADEKPAKRNTLTPKEVAGGWVLLFDGETTFGWKIEGEDWVKDGELVIGGETAASATVTSMYRDWQLHLRSQGDGKLVLHKGKGGSVSAGLTYRDCNLWATTG